MSRFRLALAFLVASAVPLLGGDLADQAYGILKEKCQICHGAAMQQSRLDLRTRDKVLLGGERGSAVVGGDPKASWLWKMVTHSVKPSMPPGGKLPDEDVEVLRRWIMAGAPFPESAASDEESTARAPPRASECPASDKELLVPRGGVNACQELPISLRKSDNRRKFLSGFHNSPS